MKEKALEKDIEANAIQKISEYTRLSDFIKEGSLSKRRNKGGSRKFSIAIT